MLRLDNKLSYSQITQVEKYTSMRFKSENIPIGADALSLYEQKYLDSGIIKVLSEEVYGVELFEPINSYIPDNIIELVSDTGYVPVLYEPSERRVTLLYVIDIKHNKYIEIPNITVITKPTTVSYYMQLYNKYYGFHEILLDLPIVTIFNCIKEEAIHLQASDLTISTSNSSAVIYYNIRKNKVYSNRFFNGDNIQNLINLIYADNPYMFEKTEPQYTSITLNNQYKGRVVTTRIYKGYSITIRLLPNKSFDEELENLNLKENVIQFLRKDFLDNEAGLRLIVGSTMSGKNTTALSCLREVAKPDNLKIVSIEIPVEQELSGVEQINCLDINDYVSNIEATIHMNPDFLYIAEMKDKTAEPTLRICNTGKRVISTLHANSVAQVVGRLYAITHIDLDLIIMTLHSIVYQELRRNNETDTVYPYNTYVRLDRELKNKLYGKSLGEITVILENATKGGD